MGTADYTGASESGRKRTRRAFVGAVDPCRPGSGGRCECRVRESARESTNSVNTAFSASERQSMQGKRDSTVSRVRRPAGGCAIWVREAAEFPWSGDVGGWWWRAVQLAKNRITLVRYTAVDHSRRNATSMPSPRREKELQAHQLYCVSWLECQCMLQAF